MHLKSKALLASILLITLSASGTALWGDFFEQSGRVAIIDLTGNIAPSSQGFSSSEITPEQVRSLTSQARSEGADAIVYEINSGGGAVVASKEVMRSIDAVEVPTVCRIRDVGASGAYLASLGCDRVVADQVSVTGSIGVTASYLEFSDLMDELGIEYVNITAGEYKEIGSPYQDISEEDREILERHTEIVHENFIDMVDENRNISASNLEQASTGEIFLGEEAKNLGLVDELGGRETAVRAAENMTGRELRAFNVESTPEFNWLSLLLGASIEDIMGLDVEAPLRSTL